MAEYPDKEEQYLLRIQDKDIADKIRSSLTDPKAQASTDVAPLDLKFTTKEGRDPHAREGQLTVGGESHAVKRQDLPTIVEHFKTYDDVNLVKTGDIGQVILLPERGKDLPEDLEATNGLTPAMCIARKRRFRKIRHVDPKLIREVEEAILQIAGGGAPAGYEFVDEEEEFVVSAEGRTGSWQPLRQKKPQANSVPSAKPPTKKKQAKQKDTTPGPEGSGIMGTEDI